RRYYRF
nr:Chain A, cyclic hexapeptide RRYYRF [synthetic construct]